MTTDGSARRKDPHSSKRPSKTQRPTWDRMNGLTLRVFYDHRDDPKGLTYWEVQLFVEIDHGPRALGKSPWKRSSELKTKYEPPLIAPVCDIFGVQVERPGEFPDHDNGAYRITDAGIYAYWQMRSKP